MVQSFSFDFGGDDIEDDGEVEVEERMEISGNQESEASLIAPKVHTLEEMLSHLPSSISYSTHHISSNDGSKTIALPRRELFDIRAQLMAEEDGPDESVTAGLSVDDIKPKVYEGGFKTWECSIDLAKYLLQVVDENDLRREALNILELGAGTAVPTSTLLSMLLSTRSQAAEYPGVRVIVADYNSDVLNLATIPNLLLASVSFSKISSLQPWSPQGELEISAELLSDFYATLTAANIRISGISGAWSHEFATLARPIVPDLICSTIILGSETIYSPNSIKAFSNTVLDLLHYSGEASRSRALVAAKKVYFGVGGGVDEFVSTIEGLGGLAKGIWDSSASEATGIGRCIMEVDRR